MVETFVISISFENIYHLENQIQLFSPEKSANPACVKLCPDFHAPFGENGLILAFVYYNVTIVSHFVMLSSKPFFSFIIIIKNEGDGGEKNSAKLDCIITIREQTTFLFKN